MAWAFVDLKSQEANDKDRTVVFTAVFADENEAKEVKFVLPDTYEETDFNLATKEIALSFDAESIPVPPPEEGSPLLPTLDLYVTKAEQITSELEPLLSALSQVMLAIRALLKEAGK